ncbi:MAG: glycosyltransferase family 2 protein [SAR324 cluster bacterium]
MSETSKRAGKISVVVPVYNEQEGLEPFFARLVPVLDGLDIEYEIVCVNDGSTDQSWTILVDQRKRNRKIKLVDLSRNFGKEAALTAGLHYATGDAVIPIDADLQDPPELILEFLSMWRQGYEIVYAVRTRRETDSWLKRISAFAFYKIYNGLARIPMPPNAGDFRLLDRRVVNAINRMPERTRFMKGLFSWVGFRSTPVYFTRQRRGPGKTKWNYWKLWNFALDGLTASTTVPLRIALYLGLLLSLFAFGYAAFLILRTIVRGIDIPGYASLMVVVLMLGGAQLVVLGMLGEYMGRIYDESKQRPVFIARESLGFDLGEGNSSR